MARLDTRDLALTTDSDRAAADYNKGVTLMLSAWPGAAERFEAAIDADPDFALAHAARARLHAICGESTKAKLRIAQAARLAETHGDTRERNHVEVLSHAIHGRSREALTHTLAHLERWPADAVILSLPLGAFGLLAFSGMADHDQARVDLCVQHAHAYADDDWWFLAHAGWALAENGEVARGRTMLERSVDLRRQNANGVHALAHALFEAGAGEEAERLIGDWLPDYGRDGILHGHLAWHTALVALDRGDAEGALAIYAEHVQPSVSRGMPINIVSDGASLLWRMEAYGHASPKVCWTELADYAGRAFPTAGHAFIDTHMLMIAAMIGDQAALDQRVASPDAKHVIPAIGQALRAFAEEDFASCARLLEPIASEVTRIGGSGAQREVIGDTLLVALMRNGEAAKARALLDQRLHRRPSPRDTRWRQSLPA